MTFFCFLSLSSLSSLYILPLGTLQKTYEREREDGWFAEVFSFVQKARFIWADMGRQVPLRGVESKEAKRGRKGRNRRAKALPECWEYRNDGAK